MSFVACPRHLAVFLNKFKTAEAQITEHQIAELLRETQPPQPTTPAAQIEEFPEPAPAPEIPKLGVFSAALEPVNLYIDGATGAKIMRRKGLHVCEYVPMNRVTALLHNDCPYLGIHRNIKTKTDVYTDEFKEQSTRQLETYVQFLAVRNKNRHILTTQYKRAPYRIKGSTKQYVIGRAFNEKGLGLTSMPKMSRNALIKDHYYDFDLENAHPAISIAIAKGLNIATPCLEYYIAHREETLKMVMEHYGVNRVLAKKLFLRLCFSGTVIGWKKEFEIDTEKDITFAINFTKEMENIAEPPPSGRSVSHCGDRQGGSDVHLRRVEGPLEMLRRAAVLQDQ